MKASFTALKCKQFSWAIYDDARKFFSRRLLPQDFLKQVVPLPVSCLDDIYGDVSYIRHVERVNFPVSWQERALPAAAPAPAPTKAPSVPPPKSFPDLTSLDHVNPQIRSVLKEFHNKFGGAVKLKQLLEEARVGLAELPKLDEFMSGNGRNMLCYSHVLGVCPYGQRCRNLKSHHDGRGLPKEFVDEMLRLIKSGADKLTRVELDALAPATREGGSYYGYQPDAKRRK